jgi:hypothetical protein
VELPEGKDVLSGRDEVGQPHVGRAAWVSTFERTARGAARRLGSRPVGGRRRLSRQARSTAGSRAARAVDGARVHAARDGSLRAARTPGGVASPAGPVLVWPGTPGGVVLGPAPRRRAGAPRAGPAPVLGDPERGLVRGVDPSHAPCRRALLRPIGREVGVVGPSESPPGRLDGAG